MSDSDLVQYLLHPYLAGRNVLDPAVQNTLVKQCATGVRSRIRFECVTEGVQIIGGEHSRLIRWEDLDQLEIFEGIEQTSDSKEQTC